MIRILVDSSSDCSQEEIAKKRMDFVPISITMGEKNYLDGIEIDRDTFYELLIGSEDFPKTSQPSPQDFLDIFRSAKEQGDDVICILLSSSLSGTFQSAVLAKNMTGYDRIFLIDSLSATYPIKLLADEACRLRDAGKTAEEIITRIEELKSRVKVMAAIDTLEYLRRGGRIGKAAAAIGELASLKPVITLNEEGEISVLGKCLGKNKAITQLVKLLQEQNLDPDFPLYVIYTYGTDNCERFEERLNKEGFHPAERLQLGATIGTHIGPEAFGIVFVTQA